MLRILRSEALNGPVLSSGADLARYLRADMAWRPNEQVRVLFLAADNRLLADEVMAEGSIDTAPLPARPIVHRALDLGAAGLILVHNHPSGSAKASDGDLAATRALVIACRQIDIAVHDHLIVARGGWTSLRLEGLL
jgi:DNA repair protein RadC